MQYESLSHLLGRPGAMGKGEQEWPSKFSRGSSLDDGYVSEAPTQQAGDASPSPGRASPHREGAAAEEAVTRGHPECPTATRAWRVGAIYTVLPFRLSFTVHDSEGQTRQQIAAYPRKHFFSSDFHGRYEPYCMDFGPVSLGVVHMFCLFMRERMNDRRLDGRELVYFAEAHVHTRTNAAFLLAAFLVLDLCFSPEEAWAPFGSITGDAFATFRDATRAPQDYELRILDCLRGLSKASQCGWYDVDTFDLRAYDYLESPFHADMHMCTPRVAAFKGPSQRMTEVVPGVFTFAPSHFVEVFKHKGITEVVRLNEADTYDPAGFTEAGIAHNDLFFADCAIPSNTLVLEFLKIVERSEGKVAVHCTAGLGGTGVMIAAHMMRHYGFTAAESIGWLRVVRPGSVIGQQQHYLHFLERALARKPTEIPSSIVPEGGWTQSAMKLEFLAEELVEAQVNRSRTLVSKKPPPPHPSLCIDSYDPLSFSLDSVEDSLLRTSSEF